MAAPKDQTYASITSRRISFAHAHADRGLYEGRVRAIAEEAGLPVAHKPDSEEICFVPDGDYASLLKMTQASAMFPEILSIRKGKS